LTTVGRYTKAQLTKRFGLLDKELGSLKRLSRHVDTLLKTAADPGVNPIKAGSFGGALAPSTLQRLKKDVLKYLGFLTNIKGWDWKRLSMSQFANMKQFAAYLDFLDARGVRVGELVKQVQVGIKVNTYMSNLIIQGSGYSTRTLDNPHAQAVLQLRAIQGQLAHRQRRAKGADVR
jgi:hypothetical protein